MHKEMNAETPFPSRTPTMRKLPALALIVRASAGRRPMLTKLLQCVLVTAMAYVSYFLISHFVLQTVQVVGTSMSPTLHPSDHLLVNRFVYFMRQPQPSDIVILKDPLDNTYAVKRIIAGAGDLVYMKNGRVYVNGRELREPYLAPGTATFPYAKFNGTSIKCGTDEYFVLGDNRRNSSDSRVYGPVPRQDILGAIIN
jgi:signal peptidase I